MFHVPEHTSMVFSYLKHHHLAQCALVSKDWHSAVMPVLWRTIPDFYSPQRRLKFRELVYEDYDYCHHAIHDPDEEDLSTTRACKPVLAIEPTKAGVSSDPLEPPNMATTLMKYGHWIRNIPEMYWFVFTLQSSKDNNSINNNSHLQKQQSALIAYELLRHFLEHLPNVRFQSLMIREEYLHKVYTHSLGQEHFLDYLIKRVLPMVQELILYELTIDVADLRRILSASAKSLTYLHINNCKVVCNMTLSAVPPMIDDVPFKARLSSLAISVKKNDLPVEFWAGFWRGCTSVTSLTINRVIPGLVKALKQDVAEHLPNLHTLCLGHGSFERRTSEVLGFSDEDVAMLLGTCTTGTGRGWRVIDMSKGATLGPRSMSVLQQHCSTLEKLAIPEITILFDLLASCPRLQALKSYGPVERWRGKPVAFMSVQQLIDWDEDTGEYRPWACEGTLQTLDITLAGLNPNENEWELHSKLYGRLARLTQLRELSVDVVKEPQMKGLAMSLEFGLAQLSGLKKMEVLDLCAFTHCPKRKDLEWMVKNWPRLRQIQGLAYKEDKWFRNHLEHMNL